MRRLLAVILLSAALWITLAGCDSYSLLAEFQRGSPLSLTLQQASLQQGGTTTLYPVGGKAPYSFGVVAGNLYYSGTLGSISAETYTAGTSIGTVIIRVTDEEGATAVAVATIVPPTPSGFTVQPNPPSPPNNDMLISWSYGSTALISGFLIQRSTDGVTFTALTTQASGATSFVDSPLGPGTTYYYRMFAVSGPYQSLPTGVTGNIP